MNITMVDILWAEGNLQGSVDTRYGELESLELIEGEGKIDGARFEIVSPGPARLRVKLRKSDTSRGPCKTLVTVRAERSPFTFWLRDVNADRPILIPRYGAAVTDCDDPRDYAGILRDISALGLKSDLAALRDQPEANWDQAAARSHRMHCETWLGLSRDERIFAFDTFVPGNGTSFGARGNILIQPRYNAKPVKLPDETDAAYVFCAGRGIGGEENTVRRLEDGVLPILHATVSDGDVNYHITSFASPEARQTLRGTHFLVADMHGYGCMQTPEQQQERERREIEECAREDTVVLCMRVVASNEAQVPRYAWFRNLLALHGARARADATGCVVVEKDGNAACLCLMDGEPLAYDEISVLVQPGRSVCFDVFIPHSPVDREKAVALARYSINDRLADCRRFWQGKLDAGAKIDVPEDRIEEMISAGLLHLDLITYGLEPDGALAPCIGVYCPIGSESSPIIQFFDSMGWDDVARRSLQYFLDKQHDDGFIQNFGGYMLETGAALWSMGEHFRYTRDKEWVREIAPKLAKSCDYLLAWRDRNKSSELAGRGYGMLDGKVADPEDPYHIFMLNGYAYLGLKRAAEMLKEIGDDRAAAYDREAEELKSDIRSALELAVSESPVVPLGDGTWCPSTPPWAEYRGPTALHADGGSWFTHGIVACRDSLVGPLYLIYQEVVDPCEPLAEFMLNSHAELFCSKNAAMSQPYYSRHDYAHVARGDVNEFLATYYNTLAGLADRETYTFWEHHCYASPHKTHEEAWFLMQTRWMLYLEDGATLRLLPAVPREWLAHESGITIERAASYFGPISLRVRPSADCSVISAEFTCDSERKPERVVLRLPHPAGLRPKEVIGGQYDPATESVVVEGFSGRCRVEVRFQGASGL